YRHSEMSSLIFFVISPIMLYLLHPYARERNLAVHLELGINVCPLPTGLFSAYFHMTLSFMGQMLDEQSILWVLGLCYALWFSLRGLPRPTLCSFVKPTANAYFLNCLALYITYSLGLEMRIDCFGCILWQKLNFCYLHILIVIAVAYASTLIAYLDANYEIPYSLPGLQYWPSDNCVLGLPYIVLKGTIKTQKRC
uniref:Alkaline ceramidase n=1 Tax=Salmo trutta TaxID=8032 RepID=A0A674B982_SALTR